MFNLIDLTQAQGIALIIGLSVLTFIFLIYNLFKPHLMRGLFVLIVINISFVIQYSLYQYTTETIPNHTYSLVLSELNLVENQTSTIQVFDYNLISTSKKTLSSVKLDCQNNSLRVCLKVVADNMDTVDYYLYSISENHLKKVIIDNDLNFSIEFN